MSVEYNVKPGASTLDIKCTDVLQYRKWKIRQKNGEEWMMDKQTIGSQKTESSRNDAAFKLL